MSEPRDTPSGLVIVSVFRDTLIGGVSAHSTSLLDRLRLDGARPVARIDFGAARTPGSSGLGARLRFFLGAASELRRLRRRRFRLAHVHMASRGIAFYTLAPVLRLLGYRVILSIHSGYGYHQFLEDHPRYARLNRVAFRLARRIVLMNDREAADLARRYPGYAERIVSIGPYIAPPPTEVPPLVAREADAPFTAVAVGLWDARYCVEEAAGATARLGTRSDRDVRFVLVMGTSLTDADYRRGVLERLRGLETEVGSRFTYEVHEDSDAVLPLLAEADVLIRSARGDSFGLVVAEALLVGTEVVATDICRRCSGARLYRPGDTAVLDAHLDAVAEASLAPEPRRNRLAPEEDAFNRYLAIYAEVDDLPRGSTARN